MSFTQRFGITVYHMLSFCLFYCLCVKGRTHQAAADLKMLHQEEHIVTIH